MNLAFDQSLFGFDLDLLHQPSNNDVDCQIVQNQSQTEQKPSSYENSDMVTQSCTSQLQKKSNGRSKKSDISNLKKKIIDTDTVVRQYYARCEQISKLENNLQETKNKCREAYIERDTIRQNCETIKKECEKLQDINLELEKTVLENEHTKAAIESHTHQLQQLVKEYDTQLEGFKVEKLLNNATIKDLEKRVHVLSKNKKDITTQLCTIADIVVSKRAMTQPERILISKYFRLKRKRDTEKNNHVKENDDSEADIHEDFLSDTEACADVNNEQVFSLPPLLPKHQAIPKAELRKDDTDGDPDLTSEVISVDTGRGSSLAFSDNDTLYSPDYYINSPPSLISVENHKHKTTMTDSTTSPIAWNKTLADKATSPIAIAVEVSEKNKSKTVNIVDKGLSPVKFPVVSNIEGIDPLPSISELTCTDNNGHLVSDNISDCEVEMILNTMKLSGGLITPIPLTPAKSKTSNEHSCECSASKLSVEDKDLRSTVEQLALELKTVKKTLNILTNKLNIKEADINENGTEDPALKQKYQNTSRVISSPDPVATYQNTSITMSSPEPEVLFEIHIIDNDEEQCVSSIQHCTNTKPLDKIQFENESDTQEYVGPISPRISHSKTNLSDKIQFEKEMIDLQSDTIEDTNDNSTLQEDNIPSSNDNKELKKVSKLKKLTRFEKLKKDLIPKSKIRRDVTPSRMLRSKTNTPSITNNNKTNIIKSSVSLNNKDVYEKAVRVMTEIKSQQKTVIPKITAIRKQISEEDIHEQKEVILKLTNEENNVDVTSKPKTVSTDLVNYKGHIPEMNYVQSETIEDKNDNSTLQDDDIPLKELKKVLKLKKLTRLEKLRKNLIPKSKIKRDVNPSRMLRSKTNTHSITNHNKTNNIGSSASLNKKDVYEKAVRVMAELKSQQKTVIPKITAIRKQISGEDIHKQKEVILKLTNEENSVDVTSKQKTVSTDLVNDKGHIPEQYNSVSVTDNTNANDVTNDTVETPNKDNSLGYVEKTLRRKSDSPEIDNILSKSRKKYPSICLEKDIVVVLTRAELDKKSKTVESNIIKTADVAKVDTPTKVVGNLKQVCNEKLETAENRRILRSAVRNSVDTENNNNERRVCDKNNKDRNRSLTPKPSSESPLNNPVSSGSLVCYNDLDLFSDEPPPTKKQRCLDVSTNSIQNPQESVLRKMIDVYGISKMKYCSTKIPEATVKAISTKITESIEHVIETPPMETKDAMNEMIKHMQKWTFKEFLAGLMQYLMDPTRKLELFNKLNVPPAPAMTKAEQVLLYIVTRLSWSNIDTVNCVLSQIEYTLFRLNQTPEMKVVESMAHFYAILCRYIKAKSRLRLFVLDAMYCMQYSAVALIKQCIEVWMHILPLAHMGTAKSPLVTCLVYLLHFYKCDDTQNKVHEIRNILKHKYFFQVTEWDETKTLEMFKNAILELKDDAVERKMLRLALILLAKRHGIKWCQNKIIKSMLMPIIAEEKVPERVKAFCISMLGALFKPYPENMKVHCEIAVNQLMDMLDKNPSPLLQEAIYTSLILLSKHNQNRVIQALLLWQPKQVSPYMESVLKDYVREKPVKVWKVILSKVSLVK